MRYLAIALVVLSACTPTKAHTRAELLAALNQVEAGGRHSNVPRGDHGLARGPMQIHRAFFSDSRVQGTWPDCDDYAFACRVSVGYWQRYCPDALDEMDCRTLACTFHYGCNWRGDDKDGYWRKVSKALDE